ncbi:MAG: hypothetical protein ACRCZF_27320 [Gemmataceae bacterium]
MARFGGMSCVLCVLALGWWVGVEVYRGCSQNHSARLFWLHLTAPWIAITLLVVALGLLVST